MNAEGENLVVEAERLFLWGVETHSVHEIEQAFAAGLEPDAPLRGRKPLEWLIEGMYLRSPRMVPCLRAILAAGARFEDQALLAVLMDDPVKLGREMGSEPAWIHRRVDLDCPFTPLTGASLLHVAAEHGSLEAARALLDAGVDPNVRAATDEQGLNGHTPIFHTVNAHRNFGRPLLELLLERGASTEIRLDGVVWGSGFDWQTVLLDVTPVSYTQCGLLKQFQRREEDIYSNIQLLLEARGREIVIDNVPNRYLRES